MIASAYPVIGFTGSKDGLAPAQLSSLEALLELIPGARELRHGDCVGADDAAHRLAGDLSWRRVVHPPLNGRRAVGHQLDVRLPPQDFMARNDAIARACSLLVACPAGPEQDRSGTWSTVRRARRYRKPIVLVLPNGAVRFERPDLMPTPETTGAGR